MTRDRDRELEDLFDRDPGLGRYVNLLRSARLKPPPLDPSFRPALRRRLMQQAYDRYQAKHRPSIFARFFSGPGFALSTAAVAILLLAAILVLNGGNLFGPGEVQVTTVGAVAVNQPITVSFNQAMDHQSVERAIQIEPATQVTYTWHGNSLSIQPSSGQLAPNTQYKVIVAADAKTAPGVKIGQAKALTVNTAPLPSPPPSPSPSPSPSPTPQIVSERSLPGTNGRIVGWSADSKTLFFIDVNDLKSINVDGSGLKIMQAGVKLASVAPSGTAIAYGTSGGSPKLYLATLDGSAPQVVDGRDVGAIGWQSGKPFVLSNGDLGPAGAAPTAKLPGPAGTAFFSPDGTRLVVVTGVSTNQAASTPIGTYLFDIASQKQTAWTTPAQSVAWSPDSARVAFWRGGSVYLAAADGSGATEMAKSPDPAALGWSADGKLLLIAGPGGASLVKADGSGLRQLSQALFQDPVWTPSGSQFAFVRGGLLWVDDLSVGGTTIDLGAAGKVVDEYEQARIKNDVAAASGLLTATASPAATPSALAADVHLSRYFVISSQASASEVRCTVRLIFAKGSNEIRYQDELLVLVPSGGGLKIDSIADSPAHDLGKGPTVNSVEVQYGKIVVVFDSDLDPKTVDGGSLRLTGADNSPVKLTSVFASRRLTITVQLTPGGKYSLAISSDVKDIAGQSLQGGYQYDFVALGPSPSPNP